MTGNPMPTAASAVVPTVAHHPGIHHVVKLLESITRQQRQGKRTRSPSGSPCVISTA